MIYDFIYIRDNNEDREMPDENSNKVNYFYIPQISYSYGKPYPLAILDTSIFGMMNMNIQYGLEKLKYFSNSYNYMPFCNAFDELLNPCLAMRQVANNWNNPINPQFIAPIIISTRAIVSIIFIL